MIRRIFALSAELSKFLQYHNHRHLKHFEGSSFLLTWLIWPTVLVPSNESFYRIWKDILSTNYLTDSSIQHGYGSHLL